MSNNHGFINKDGSITFTRTDHITVEDCVKVVEQKYEGITKPHAKLEHERYYKNDGFNVRNTLYDNELKDSQTGVLWVKASMVFVPYNRDLLVECVKDAMKETMETDPQYWRGNMIENIAYKAVNLYRSSKYYVETFKQKADECQKEMNARYSAPDLLRTSTYEKARSEQLRQSSQWTLDYIDMDDLPKSTPTSVRNMLQELRNRLINAITTYDNHEKTIENYTPY